MSLFNGTARENFPVAGRACIDTANGLAGNDPVVELGDCGSMAGTTDLTAETKDGAGLLISSRAAPVTELLFVDSDVANTELLLDQMSQSIDIVRLQEGIAPLDQIAETLKGHGTLDAVHILSHGASGALALAGQELNSASLKANPGAVSTIKAALSGGAKLALWACSVAADEVGKVFVNSLSSAFGADVFASAIPVGAASQGGTWDIGIPAPFASAGMAAYPHTLPTFDFTGGSGNGTATYTETESGVTMTVVDDSGDTVNIFNAGTAAGLSGDAIAFGGTGSLTVTFDQGVTVTSFRYVEDDGTLVGTDSVIFTPTGGTGTTITKTAVDFANSGFDITPTDWVGVTGFTVTFTGATPIDPILDTIVFNVAPRFQASLLILPSRKILPVIWICRRWWLQTLTVTASR